jgi:hypothetical protein
LATLGVLAPTILADTFIIDGFSQPSPVGQSVSVTQTGSLSDTQTGLAGVVGGARKVQIDATGNASNISSLIVDPSTPGTLSFNNGAGQNATGTITWNNDTAGLGGVDLGSVGANPYLQAHILSSDLNLGFRVEITETNTGLGGHNGDMAYWSINLGSGVSYVNQALSSFTNAGNVDFTQVDKIVLILSGPNAEDGMLDLLEVTNTPAPEPATLSLLALGGLAMLRRRKHN